MPGGSISVLVLGAGGLLGRHVVALGATGVDRTACDVRSPSDRARVLADKRPDVVVYCAAQASVDACESDPGAWALNVDAPAAWAHELPLWYVSSNYVFSGHGPHGVAATTAPLQAYGRQKRAGELAVLDAGGHVVRTGWLFGAGGRNFLSTLPTQLRQGPVRAFGGVPIQPTWAGDLARVLLTLPTGITHAVGCETTTFVDAARTVAATLGLAPEIIELPGPAGLLPAERPRDARLTPAELPGWSQRWRALIAER